MEAAVELDFPAIFNDLSAIPAEIELGTYLNDHPDVMVKKLDMVKTLLDQEVDDARFNQAIGAIHFMVDKVPLLMNRLWPGMPVFRARANEKSLFSSEEELSYNKMATDNIAAGRFNRPLEPLFYGSLMPETPKTDPVLNCALECCKSLVDDAPPPVQDITVGRWISQGWVPMINLCFDERHLALNPALKASVDRYRSDMAKIFNSEGFAFINDFMKFFSELAWSVKENKNAYYILNAFFFAVRYYYAETRGTAVPGIIYPSAMTEGLGLNVVLVPQAVDFFLKLDMVYMQRFVLVSATKNYVSDPCSELLRVTDGRFQFKRVRPYAAAGRIFTYGL